jgi:hypothetical protein
MQFKKNLELFFSKSFVIWVLNILPYFIKYSVHFFTLKMKL